MAAVDERVTFKAQSSINLALALMNAAFALIAGILAGLFAVADKIPSGHASWMIFGGSSVALVSCLLSVYFGGRGITCTTMNLLDTKPPPAAYDGGNFNRQGLAGTLGLIVVILVIIVSATVLPQRGERDQEIKKQLQAVENRIDRASERVDQLASEQNRLSLRVAETLRLATKPADSKKH